jgi:hypothetical protein
MDLAAPCLNLPKIPNIPKITLMGGAELKAFADFSLGPQSDCKLIFSLLLQLAPALASMACLFKILNVISKLKELADVITMPLKLPVAAKGLIDAIVELTPCIPPLAPLQFALMIKGILNLVISFLNCFIDQLESIVQFQASIDISSAEGNPTLRATLLCAQDNAKTSMDNLMMSLQPLQPILEMVGTLIGIVGLPALDLPKMADISASTEHLQTISSIKDAVDTLKTAINALPG